jgi:2-keto-4-pentenoate hydratase/2-oxohepta-3-ene-1,7-dioic acid hydratase in catechol pathway
MRVVRFIHEGMASWGIAEGDGEAMSIVPLARDPFAAAEPAGNPIAALDVELVAPAVPSKVVGYGRNYAHVKRAPDGRPEFFLKPPTAVVGPGREVVFPALVPRALPEPELTVVIGRACRNVDAADYADVVFGYTCGNDLTGRADPAAFGQSPFMAKAFDTFCPIGPWIETELDPSDLALGCRVNGEEVPSSRTSEMLTKVPELVALTSQIMTLLPGDVILTGTPRVETPLVVGDEVTVWIEGIGELTNRVCSDST